MQIESSAAVSPSATTTSSLVGNAVEAERETTAISDFNDFLTLLTTQMKNQDPLQPLDSTQFVEQLASFSAVEQQVGSNKKLDELIKQGNSGQISELGGWIGQNVRADKALFQFDEDGLTVAVPALADADSIEAIIRDTAGTEVARVPVEKADDEFVWSGKTSNGGTAKHDQYSVAFEYAFKDQSPRVIEAAANGQVVEATIDAKGPLLTLDSGEMVRIDDIQALTLAKASETES